MLWVVKGGLYSLLLLCFVGGMGAPLAESQLCYRTAVFSQPELLFRLEGKYLTSGLAEVLDLTDLTCLKAMQLCTLCLKIFR